MTIFTFENIYKAYQDCRKQKKNTANALKFEMDREKNLMKLLNELRDRRYKISRHICFVVTYPAPREIFAADFRDRIVHHLLCNQIQNIFERGFSENFANVYLNELDQFIENKFSISKYLRYVDDFVILDEDIENLKEITKQITRFCEERLLLKICLSKTILRDTKRGVDFLGYFVKPTHTLVRRKVVLRFKDKFFKVLDSEGFVSKADIPMIKSYVGHFSHANSHHLQKRYNLM